MTLYFIINSLSSLMVIPFTISYLYLMLKIVISRLYVDIRSHANTQPSISVILPIYNESLQNVTALLKTLKKQTLRIDELIVVDDGSNSLTSFKYFQNTAVTDAVPFRIKTFRYAKNQGKKHALSIGIQNASNELLLFVDSDIELSADSVERLFVGMQQNGAMSAVGNIKTLSSSRHGLFLTALQRLIYQNTFSFTKKAQSVLGSVLVCSGAFSMHHRSLILDHFNEFINPVTAHFFDGRTGDDIALTNITLKAGKKAVFVESAVAHTYIPTTVRQYFRQQVRWNRDGYIYSIDLISGFWQHPLASITSIFENFFLFFLVLGQIFALLADPLSFLTIAGLLTSFVYVVVLIAMDNFAYLESHYLNIFVPILISTLGFPLQFVIRLYALLSIKHKSSWGTR
ncbi:glycosyltransferase family 2 protein [Lacticaseibacillus saniviri]